MTIQEAVRAAGDRPIQRLDWTRQFDAWRRPDWALLWCANGCPMIMPREAMCARYCLTLDEVMADDWQVVPLGKEGVILDYCAHRAEEEAL